MMQQKVMRRTGVMDACAAALLTMLFAAPAFAGAAPTQPLTTAQTGAFTGPDRLQRLIAGAKREGSVDVYSSATAEVMNAVEAGFERKYGIRVNVWKAASVTLLQRTLTEARAGRFAVDVIETPATEVEPMARERILQEVRLPVFSEMMPGAVVAGRPWIATRLIVFSGGYNTNLVRPADVPKTYEDLLHPRWRGKIGLEATDANWFMSLVQSMGEEKGMKLFRDIASTNGFSVRRGHVALNNLLISGEVPIALNVYQHTVQPAKAQGAPVEELRLSPVLAIPSAAAVMRRAPHPHAAILFLEYLLSDGQPELTGADGAVPTNLRYQKLPADLKLSFVDVPRYVTENEKWRDLFHEIQTTQPRGR
jgi:iron(III) transport system substrate-binding protein